ncbi:unnamed protein product [Cunninghamella blakesleeana]
MDEIKNITVSMAEEILNEVVKPTNVEQISIPSTTITATTTSTTPSLQYQPTDLLHYERRHFMDGCDISKDFHDFRVHISSLLNADTRLTLESHVHHILAKSNIFLFSPKRIHSDIKNILSSNTIDLSNNHLSTTYWNEKTLIFHRCFYPSCNDH